MDAVLQRRFDGVRAVARDALGLLVVVVAQSIGKRQLAAGGIRVLRIKSEQRLGQPYFRIPEALAICVHAARNEIGKAGEGEISSERRSERRVLLQIVDVGAELEMM